MGKGAESKTAISASEWAVMNVFWDDGPLAVGDVYAKLAANRDWAYSTVKTLIRRLADKGWLDYQRVGNSFLYKAAVPRRQAVRSAIREFSARVLNGLLSPLVADFAEQEDLTPEDIAQLEKIVKRYRRKGDE